jgi:homoserine kinase
MQDVIVEPMRAILIPNFQLIKAAALNNGAFFPTKTDIIIYEFLNY